LPFARFARPLEFSDLWNSAPLGIQRRSACAPFPRSCSTAGISCPAGPVFRGARWRRGWWRRSWAN